MGHVAAVRTNTSGSLIWRFTLSADAWLTWKCVIIQFLSRHVSHAVVILSQALL
jgi:hypothetical protein